MTKFVCRGAAKNVAQDALLACALVVLLAGRPFGHLSVALALAIPVVIVWGAWTIHFPTSVEVDDAGIAFSRYGRTHAFLWSQIERIRVRRFLVKDRVLVRVTPAPALAGKYWLLSSMDGYERLVATLEERARIGVHS